MAAIEPAVHILKPPPPGCEGVLSGDAIAFLTTLARRFESTRQELLERRHLRQLEIDAGRLPDFLPETRDVRERDWTVAAIRPDLLDRRVEITGPVGRKMMINAFNSSANVFMADFEDSNAPTWGKKRGRPAEPARRRGRHHRVREPGGEARRAHPGAGAPDGAAARL